MFIETWRFVVCIFWVEFYFSCRYVRIRYLVEEKCSYAKHWIAKKSFFSIILFWVCFVSFYFFVTGMKWKFWWKKIYKGKKNKIKIFKWEIQRKRKKKLSFLKFKVFLVKKFYFSFKLSFICSIKRWVKIVKKNDGDINNRNILDVNHSIGD